MKNEPKKEPQTDRFKLVTNIPKGTHTKWPYQPHGVCGLILVFEGLKQQQQQKKGPLMTLILQPNE